MQGHKISHLPIRYFLALLWAHPILHVSRIRVNQLYLDDTVISEYPGRGLHIPCVNPAYSFKFNMEVLFKQFFTVAHIFNISWCMQTAHKEIFQIMPTVNRNGTGKPLRQRAHRPVAMCWGFKCLCLEQQPRAWRQLHSLSSASVASNVRMQLPCFHALSITSGLILCCCMMWLGQHFNITYV